MSLRHYRKASQTILSLQPNNTSNGDNYNDPTKENETLASSNSENTIEAVSEGSSSSDTITTSAPLVDYGTFRTESQDVDNRLPAVSHTETGSIVCGNNVANDQTNINNSDAAATFVCIPVSGATSTFSMPQVIVLQDSENGTGVVEETEKPCCAICLQADMHFLTEETNADVMTAISKSLRTALKFHSTLKIYICELCRLLAAVVNSYSSYCGGTEPSSTAVECIDKLTIFWKSHRPQKYHGDTRSPQSFCNFALAPQNTYLGSHPSIPTTFAIPTVQLVAPFATVPVLQFQSTYPPTSFGTLEIPNLPLQNSLVETETNNLGGHITTSTQITSPLYTQNSLEPSSTQQQSQQSSPTGQDQSAVQSTSNINKQTSDQIQNYNSNFSTNSNKDTNSQCNNLNNDPMQSTSFLQHNSRFFTPPSTQSKLVCDASSSINDLYSNQQSQDISSSFINGYNQSNNNSNNQFLHTQPSEQLSIGFSENQSSPQNQCTQKPESTTQFLTTDKETHIATLHDDFFCNQEAPQQNTTAKATETASEFLPNSEFITYSPHQLPSTSGFIEQAITPKQNNQENENTHIEYSSLQNSLGMNQTNFGDNEPLSNKQSEHSFSPGTCFEQYQNSYDSTTNYPNIIQHNQSPYTSTSSYSNEKSPLDDQFINPVFTTIDFPKVNTPLPSTSYTNEQCKTSEISHEPHPISVEFLEVPEPLPTASSIIEEPPLLDEKDASADHVNFFLDRDTLSSNSSGEPDECVENNQANSLNEDQLSNKDSPNECDGPSTPNTLHEAIEDSDSCSTIILSSSSSVATPETLDNETRDTEIHDTDKFDIETLENTADSWASASDTNFVCVSSLNDEDTTKTCEVCGKQFADLRGLRCHERARHKTQEGETSANPDGYMCKMCKEIIKDKDEYKKHTKRHYSALFYQAQKEKGPQLCTHCGNSFYILSQHLLCCKSISRERVKCFMEGCGKYYMSEKQLQRHQHRVHLKATSKACNICGKVLASKDALKRHINFKHKNIRNYSCSICEKKFHTAFHLRMHLRSHDRAPLYNCPYCTASFVYNHVLKMHMRKNHADQQALADGDDFNNITGLEQWTGSMPLAQYDNTGHNDQWLF